MPLNNKYIIIIDIGIGNIQSVSNAVQYNNCNCIVSNKKQDIINSSGIILPGVGAFNLAMDRLKEYGIIDTLKQEVITKHKPILGICLGMQMLFDSSTENYFHNGLGFIKGTVEKIEENVKLPHVGWNNLNIINDKILLKNIKKNSDLYFDHTYHVKCNENFVTSACFYEKNRIIASVRDTNIFGTQFHPEKSQHIGLMIIKNFINYTKSIKC